MIQHLEPVPNHFLRALTSLAEFGHSLGLIGINDKAVGDKLLYHCKELNLHSIRLIGGYHRKDKVANPESPNLSTRYFYLFNGIDPDVLIELSLFTEEQHFIYAEGQNVGLRTVLHKDNVEIGSQKNRTNLSPREILQHCVLALSDSGKGSEMYSLVFIGYKMTTDYPTRYLYQQLDEDLSLEDWV